MNAFKNKTLLAQRNTSCSDPGNLTSVLHATVIIFIMVVIIVGNVFVLLVIYRQRTRASSRAANMFIANLAVVDLSIACLLFPFSVVTILLQRWALGDAACQFNGATNMIAGAASILTMAVISIDRYLRRDFCSFYSKTQCVRSKWFKNLLAEINNQKYENLFSQEAGCSVATVKL